MLAKAISSCGRAKEEQMSPQFEIGGYTIKLGRRLATRVADQTVTATGWISFLGEDFMSMNVYFVDDGSPVPDPVVSRDGNVATLFLRNQFMPLWIDVLRNEKPIFGVIDTAQPSAPHITTKVEQIGEEET
jgi:hypothetical protein